MPTSSLGPEARLLRAFLVTLVLLLVGTGCKSARSAGPVLAPEPTPPGRWSEAVLERGWITVSLGLPYDRTPPYPVVLQPILPDHELLARGIGVVRWKTNWGALSAFKAADTDRETAKAPSGKPKTKAGSGPSPGPEAATAEPETVGVWLLRAPRPGIVGRAYFQLITNEAHNSIPKVVDHLVQHPDVDPKRIAITGSSTGGFTALQAMAEDPRIAVGVVQVACGEYKVFLKSSSLALDDQERWLEDGRIVLDAAYDATLDAIDPVARADHFPPRPLLLISGAQDRAIPAECVARTATHFGRAYEQAGVPKRFEWVEFEERGHNMGPEAPPLILEFLERWLETDARLLPGP